MDSDPVVPWWKRLFFRLAARKPMAAILRESEQSQMNRTLGCLQLICISIGAIIGAGIFVLTGVAAAENAGPAVIVSFLIAGFVSGLSALSYSEFSTMVPISGSAFSYTYASMGELLAWIVGWDLTLEYVVGAATVCVSWSSYVVTFFSDAFNVQFTKKTTQAPVLWNNDRLAFEVNHGSYINIPAIFVALMVTTLLILGIKQSAIVNQVIVAVKIVVILVFIFASIQYVDRANYSPFVPPRQNNSYGAKGVFQGVQRLLFSYIGFDAVSTAAQEARNPGRNLPIAICASLCICTVLYVGVSAVLCGIAPYSTLGVASPITFALQAHPNTKWLRILTDLGAIAGLTSVILVLLLSQPRIFFAMARDGLFPRSFGRLHRRFKTPWVPTLVSGIVTAVLAGVLPVDLLGDMTSVGTLLAFILVNIGVIIMRFTHPHAYRGFRVPGGPFVIPVLGAAISLVILVLSNGPTIYRLFAWLGIGLIVYAFFGYRHSRLGNPQRWAEEDTEYFGGSGLIDDHDKEQSVSSAAHYQEPVPMPVPQHYTAYSAGGYDVPDTKSPHYH
ncbi:hypothetical protein H4S02_000807 [Coemansia sp. RSA 2611]|nr:hypothetical protein H4S02_000807 [Coemansia sp. RSA 2611]